jgi:cob(I)alamin adenosyltransferase
LANGDDGFTELCGQRVSKADARIEALGQLDELQALMGLALASPGCEAFRPSLGSAVKEAARAMEALAAYPVSRPFPAEALERLDGECLALGQSSAGSGFILPGADPASALLHLCRTVARRAERSLCAAAALMDVPESVKAWINRLSEWFFYAAVAAEKRPPDGARLSHQDGRNS